MVPQLPWGGRKGELFFYVDFFFYSVFPFPSAPFGAPGGFSHLPNWSPGLSFLCLLILTCK